MALAFGFLLGSTFEPKQHSAAADIPREVTPPPQQLGAAGFDLRTVGFDLRRAAQTAPLLAQFRQELFLANGGILPAARQRPLLTILTPDDCATYQRAFAAALAGDASATAAALKQLHDPLLRGTVEAMLLQNMAEPDYAALTAWLQQYRSLPQAAALHALAQQQRPRHAPAPPTPTTGDIARGSVVEGLHRGLANDIIIDGSGASAHISRAQNFNALLRRGDHAAAATVLMQAEADFPVSWRAAGEAAMAAALFFSGQEPGQLSDTTISHAPLGAWIGGLQAWRAGDYGKAAQYFGTLSGFSAIPVADRAAGAFWQGRALHKAGNKSAARRAWQQAAQYPRSFYGQLAQAALGIRAKHEWVMPRLTPAGLQQLAEQSAGRRGLALLQLDCLAEAEAELQRVDWRAKPALALTLASLAAQTKMPALALQMGNSVKHPTGGVLNAALYPVPEWQYDAPMEAALVYAVARQESAFNPRVVSRAGARGLMQLMPETARSLDAGLQLSRLAETEYNVALGSRYLAQLAETPDLRRSLPLIIAAYNGGPGNVRRWQAVLDHGNDPLLFIESLPVRETRHYVQIVLSNYWFYQNRLGQKSPSLVQLASGQWPKLTAPTVHAQAEIPLRLASK